MAHLPAPPCSALLCAATLLAGTSGALALEAEAFAQRFQDAADRSGSSFDYGDATLDGTTITFSDVTVTPAAGDRPISFETMVFSGVSETADGGYTVEEASIPGIDITEDDLQITVGSLTISALDIPGVDTGDEIGIDDIVFYEQARGGPLSIVSEESEVFRMEELMIDVERMADDAGAETMLRASGLQVDLSSFEIENARTREALDAMGYEMFTGSMTMAASWVAETGEIDLSDYTLAIDDVGSLTMAFSLSGYTLEFVEALQQAREAAESGGNDEIAGMAMLGLMQQLTFTSASIAFQDDALTGKVLDYVGGQQGVSGDQMAQAVKGMMPLMLGQLRNPAFQQQVNAAVGAYLDDPQSLRISAEPDEPVPFTVLMGAGAGAPETLPDVLGLTVTANE